MNSILKNVPNRQHIRGKLSAIERINLLLDPGSFEEIGRYVKSDNQEVLGDGVITGRGRIYGRTVFVYSQDFNVSGGSVSRTNALKICRVMDAALLTKTPVIGINDSGGARIQDGVNSLSGYGEIFQRNVDLSGVVPQISLIMGPCAGGAVYSPAITDFVFMTRSTSYMFVTGPNIVKKVLHQDVTKEELGGFSMHNCNGVIDGDFEHDIEMLLEIRRFFAFLPSNNLDNPPILKSKFDSDYYSMSNIIPSDNGLPYDVCDIILCIVDNRNFFELSPNFAKSIVIGFGRINGETIGVVANQPLFLAGCLDVDSSKKAARFVRFCDAFNIPIITLVDVPGFLPGLDQEKKGVIKDGAKLLYAYAEATVPKISIITRKAYGGAYIVMNSKHLCSDFNYAWPTAEIAVMGAEGAIEIIYKKLSNNKDKVYDLIKEYRKKFANPYVAAAHGFIDDVIEPNETKKRIASDLIALRKKQIIQKPWKKHDNLPI